MPIRYSQLSLSVYLSGTVNSAPRHRFYGCLSDTVSCTVTTYVCLSARYRQLLVRTLHSCSIKFQDVSATVIPLLTEFLSDSNELAAADVLVFLREAVQRFDHLRPLVLEQLLEAYPIIG